MKIYKVLALVFIIIVLTACTNLSSSGGHIQNKRSSEVGAQDIMDEFLYREFVINELDEIEKLESFKEFHEFCSFSTEAFIIKYEDTKADEIYFYDVPKNPGQLSTANTATGFYDSSIGYLFNNYQCDIDGDGKEERILINIYEDMTGKYHRKWKEIKIEAQDENGKYKVVIPSRKSGHKKLLKTE